jgi:hypothetical protein
MSEEEADPVTIVHCEKGHKLYWFRSKNQKTLGKIYWKSDECRSFYNNNYINALAPYDELEKTVRCIGK